MNERGCWGKPPLTYLCSSKHLSAEREAQGWSAPPAGATCPLGCLPSPCSSGELIGVDPQSCRLHHAPSLPVPQALLLPTQRRPALTWAPSRLPAQRPWHRVPTSLCTPWARTPHRLVSSACPIMPGLLCPGGRPRAWHTVGAWETQGGGFLEEYPPLPTQGPKAKATG